MDRKELIDKAEELMIDCEFNCKAEVEVCELFKAICRRNSVKIPKYSESDDPFGEALQKMNETCLKKFIEGAQEIIAKYK